MNTDLTATEQRIVTALRDVGPLTSASIGEELGIPASTANDTVNRLIARKVLTRKGKRGPVRLVESTPKAAGRGRPKAWPSQQGSPLSAAWEQAKADPAGTIGGLQVLQYLSGTVISIVATALGWRLVGLVAGRVATGQLGAIQAPAGAPKPGMWPAAPPAASNGHSAPPVASTGLRVVPLPAHRDPKHSCRWPGAGYQIGSAWVCDLELGTGCGRTWTWTGDGWTPELTPAAFEARRKLVGMPRDVYVQSRLGAGVLRSPYEVQSELQRRIAEYAAHRPEPGALRTLRAMALKNPARADELLKRAGY